MEAARHLGNGATPPAWWVKTPVQVRGLASGVTAVTAGRRHTCALTRAGAVKCWGTTAPGNSATAPRTAQSTPVQVIGLTSDVTAISAGGAHTCALTRAGAMKCWGFNYDGELGNGTTNLSTPTPVPVIGLTSGVTAISAGGLHTCAVTSAGAVKCWGITSMRPLGNGTTNDSTTPVQVTGSPTVSTAITAGNWHACALTSAGAVKCWG